MIALIDSAGAPSWHYDSKQHEDISARLHALTLSPTQFQAQLATWLIRTHSWRICALRLPCPVAAKTTHSLAVFLGCMSRYLSAGNGRSDFHILLFNEHSTPLSNGALIGSYVMHHLRWSFGRQYQSHIAQHHLHILAFSHAQSKVRRSTWCAFVPRLCDSVCTDAIISACSLAVEGCTEGWVSEMDTNTFFWSLQHKNIEKTVLMVIFTWEISVFVFFCLLFSLFWKWTELSNIIQKYLRFENNFSVALSLEYLSHVKTIWIFSSRVKFPMWSI